jgi:Tfp pilus assembly protein PilF
MEAQDKLSEAIKYYDKALEIDPNNALVLNNKGFDLNRLGNDEALRIDPKYVMH